MKTNAQHQRDGSVWPFRIFITGVIILIVSLATCEKLNAQFREKPLPAVYIAYQPWDHGVGLRGDYHLTHWAGFYGSASYGQWNLYRKSGLDKHVKLTAGILIPYKDWNGNQHDFTIGANYHWVSGEVEESEIFKDDPQFHKPWSFELGLTIKFPRFALGMRTDVLRWEPCIDVGIPIGRKNVSMRNARTNFGK